MLNVKTRHIFQNVIEKLKKQREKQEKYWEERNENQFLVGEKQGLQLVKALENNYKTCLQEIEKQINAFYGKYAAAGKLDLQTARKQLSKEELKSFRKQLDDIIQYAKNNKLATDYINKMKLLNIKLKVSRLQALETEIQYELAKLSVETEKQLSGYLSETYKDNYYKAIYNMEQDIGYKIGFERLSTNIIEKAISKNYYLGNYSVGINKVWENTYYLNTILEQKIPQGLALGYNPKKLANIVDKQLNTRI